MDVNGALGIVVAVFTIALTAGGLAAFFRNMQKATLETYKEDNEALRHRVGTLEDQHRDDHARIGQLEKQVETLTRDNELLRTIVPGTEAIAALSDLVVKQHEQVMAGMKVIGGALTDIAQGRAS